MTELEFFDLGGSLLTLGLGELLLEPVLHLFEVGSGLRLINGWLERELFVLNLLRVSLCVLQGLLHATGHSSSRVALFCCSMDPLEPLFFLERHLLAIDLD